jgi:hypothetical protein
MLLLLLLLLLLQGFSLCKRPQSHSATPAPRPPHEIAPSALARVLRTSSATSGNASRTLPLRRLGEELGREAEEALHSVVWGCESSAEVVLCVAGWAEAGELHLMRAKTSMRSARMS